MFIRLTSVIVGLVSLLAPIWLAAFVSGVLSPERPISFSYLSIYILVGFALSLGYFCIAIFHRKLAAAPLVLRLFVSALLTLPLAFAFYLAVGTHRVLVTAVCLAISFIRLGLFTFVCGQALTHHSSGTGLSQPLNSNVRVLDEPQPFSCIA